MCGYCDEGIAMNRGFEPAAGRGDLPEELVEMVARALFEAAELIPGASIPVIAAEELAREAIKAVRQAGCLRLPSTPEYA